MILNQKIDSLMMIVGRVLLGIYFLLPGLGKILTYSDNIILLTSKGVPLTQIALPLTILIEESNLFVNVTILAAARACSPNLLFIIIFLSFMIYLDNAIFPAFNSFNCNLFQTKFWIIKYI